MNKNNCICLICYKPNGISIDFLSKFTNYDIYIIIDDNTIEYKNKYTEYVNINIIQIKNEDCKINGFSDVGFFEENLKITGWDKAIYYFSTINTIYKNIWLLEEDVFLYNEKTLTDIDFKYKDSDLLSSIWRKPYISDERDMWEHWPKIDIKFPPPYYSAMICAIRVTQTLLNKIKDYATEYKVLFFSEALFPTICKMHNLKYDTPTEFNNIVYKKAYKDTDIDENNLFHPVKDIAKHKYYRDMLKTKLYIK